MSLKEAGKLLESKVYDTLQLQVKIRLLCFADKTKQLQRIRLTTDKHFLLDSEDDFSSCCGIVSHQQQFFSELPVADPDLELRGGRGGGGVLIYLLGWPFSLQSSFFTQNRGREPTPRVPPLDPSLTTLTQKITLNELLMLMGSKEFTMLSTESIPVFVHSFL